MSERYPDEATLLSLSEDEATGVEYIPTGLSPYHVAFRKMLYRLLRATERANDLRVYADGDLSVGVRPGRCFVGEAAVAFEGASAVGVSAEATTWLWLDEAGAVQSDTAGLPAERGTFVPLAKVEAGAEAIEAVTDLRGEAMLAAPSLAGLGVAASAEEIDRALAGIDPAVTAADMNVLFGGPASDASNLHRHTNVFQEVDGEAGFQISNWSSGADAAVALRLGLPEKLWYDSRLLVNGETGTLRQRYGAGPTYELVGTVHATHRHGGELSQSQSGELIGMVPIDGEVSDVVVSVGANVESDHASDGVRAIAYVNGQSLCTTDPAVLEEAGGGFRSTAQGDGTAAVVRDDGTEQVQRGDVLTVDLNYEQSGNVSQPPQDVTVMVVVRAAGPE